jgi:hypothetical protein
MSSQSSLGVASQWLLAFMFNSFCPRCLVTISRLTMHCLVSLLPRAICHALMPHELHSLITIRRLIAFSVLVNCCWPSPAQWFLVPSPVGLMTIFSESQSELLHDWWFTLNQFILAPSPLRLTTTDFFLELHRYGHSPLMRGWVCLLWICSAFVKCTSHT